MRTIGGMEPNVWQGIAAEARDNHTLATIAIFVFAGILTAVFLPAESKRLRASAAWLGLHLVTLPVAGFLRVYEIPGYQAAHLAAVLFEAFTLITVASILIFGAILPRLGVAAPRILRDVLVATAYAVCLLALATQLGLNISGVIATSTVITAVIGLSLQDTLGNVMAGLALEIEGSVEEGDWIMVGDHNGRVLEVGWRSTLVETRNWETMVIPNSTLVRNSFTILGRRSGKPPLWRRWVYFSVDYRFPPGDVIETVNEAVRAAPIDYVASDPMPQTVLMDFHESYGRYAVRYWLTDLAVDDPTDSAVRTRTYFALNRAGIPLSIPAHAIFVTEESRKRKAAKAEEEIERRREALSHVDFFEALPEKDRERLASSLRHAPFSKGEVMTRQGAEAHWLYLIISGEASVRVAAGEEEREIGRLRSGHFFGEMSLMTGEPRNATVVALSNVECYRLDKSAFQAIMDERPELAEGVAAVLSKRRVTLEAAQEDLDAEANLKRVEAAKHDLLGSIRKFFGLRA